MRRRVAVPLDRVAAAPVPVRLRAERAARRAAPRRCCTACRAPSRRPSSARGAPRASAGWTRSRPRPARRPRAQRRTVAVRPPTTTPPSTSSSTGRVVADLDPVRLGRGGVLVDQPAPAVDDADRQPAPEPVPAVGLVATGARTSAGSGCRARAASGSRPPESPREHARHRLVAAPERDPPHVGLELRRRCTAAGRSRPAADRPRRTSRSDSTPVVRDPHRARGERRVAARPLARRLLEHEHASARARAPPAPPTSPRSPPPRRSRRRPCRVPTPA